MSTVSTLYRFRFIFLFYVVFNRRRQGHVATGSFTGWRKPVHTSRPRFCTVNHGASASNYQLSNMKCPGRDSNRPPQRLKASTLTATPTSPFPPPVGPEPVQTFPELRVEFRESVCTTGLTSCPGVCTGQWGELQYHVLHHTDPRVSLTEWHTHGRSYKYREKRHWKVNECHSSKDLLYLLL